MKTIRVVAAIICDSVQEPRKIFATARGYGEFKGQWEFPGGKIEEGEDKKTALIREIKEELKLSKYVFQRAIKELSNTDLIVITGNGQGRAYSKSLTKLELYVGVQKLADRLRMGN